MDTDSPAEINPSLDPPRREMKHHKNKSLKLDFDIEKQGSEGQLFGKVASPKLESPEIDEFMEKPNPIEMEVEAIHAAYKVMWTFARLQFWKANEIVIFLLDGQHADVKLIQRSTY